MRELNVSIVIPAYNVQETIARTIEACLNQIDSSPCEIIITDDGSTDLTADIVKTYPVRYIYQGNAGPAKARNKGWKAAIGGVICFTDSDCIPHPNWVASLLRGFDSNETGAVAGSYDIVNQGSFLAQCIHHEIKDRHRNFGNSIRAFGSYNVAIKREVLDQTGGFDESYKSSSAEDNDLSYRILEAGYRIAFRSDALVGHHHTEKLWAYLREQYCHGYWRMKLYRNFPDMSRGDDYTTLKDIIEPPLTLMVVLSSLFLWNRYGLFAFLILLISIVFLQIPRASRIMKRQKNFKSLYLVWVTFLRAFARGFGMGKGIWRFWL